MAEVTDVPLALAVGVVVGLLCGYPWGRAIGAMSERERAAADARGLIVGANVHGDGNRALRRRS